MKHLTRSYSKCYFRILYHCYRACMIALMVFITINCESNDIVTSCQKAELDGIRSFSKEDNWSSTGWYNNFAFKTHCLMNNSVAIQKLKWKSADNETLEEDMGLKLMLVEESNENMEIEENSNPELRILQNWGDSMLVELMKYSAIIARKSFGISRLMCLDGLRFSRGTQKTKCIKFRRQTF